MADARPEGGPAILMVTRRFWPHTDDATGRLAVLAEGLRRSGARPALMAPRYSAAWPSALVYREIPVHRPVAAPRGDWSSALYQRGLARWLREHVSEYDAVYADNMRDEGAAVVDAAIRGGIPSIVRCSGTGENSDAQWASGSRSARRLFNQCLRGGGLIAPTALAARALIACGAPPAKVHRIDDGVPAGPRRDEPLVAAARACLALANSDLRVPKGGRVVLCPASLDTASGVLQLAEAIVPLCERWPDLRVWFIGDGPSRERLHGFLREHGIREATALPGCFGHVEELLRAADIMVLPSDSDSLEQRLPAALGAGVPTIVPDTPETRSLLGPAAQDVATFVPGNMLDLRRVLRASIEDYSQMQQRAADARGTLRQLNPRERSIAAHFELITQMLKSTSAPGGPRTIDLDRPTGATS